MAEITMKKTGATPTVDLSDLSGGKVHGVLPVTTVLIKYEDGHGKSDVRLAVVIPGGEVYFFVNNSLDMRPAQQWLKTAVFTQLNRTKPGEKTGMIEITEESSQV